MSEYNFKLPDIGEGIAQAEIVAWHVSVGDLVSEDQPIVDMMTDKATVEIESPVAGRVLRLAGEAGDQVPIGSVLMVLEIEAGNNAPEEAPSAPPPAEDVPLPEEEQEEAEDDREDEAEEAPPPAPVSSPPAAAAASAPVVASPAVRARAKALHVDLSHVKTSDGRVRHSDLDAYLLYNAGQGYGVPGAGSVRADETVKVIGLRRRIADNMAASKRHIPHFAYVEEVDVTELEAARAELNAARGDRPKLTLLPLLISAICRTVPDFPMINARYDDEAGIVTRHGSVHLGIATQTPAGLMVPVIRDAQNASLWQLAGEIARLADAARSGKARSEELSGSTLTITSLGPLGGIATTPVINRPEVAIIGPNRIVERPMFVPDGLGGERIARRKLMNVSISCDHRVVDGWDAANFVQAIRALLEHPVRLLV